MPDARLRRPRPKGRGISRIEGYERQEAAWALAVAGRSSAEIAAELGYASPAEALAAIRIAVSRRPLDDDARELAARTIYDRCDKAAQALMPAVAEGDTKAVAALMLVLSRVSKLLGLDAPVRLAGHDGGALTINVEVRDARAKLAERIDELTQRRLAAG